MILPLNRGMDAVAVQIILDDFDENLSLARTPVTDINFEKYSQDN